MKLEFIKKEGKNEILLITNTNEKEAQDRLLYELYTVAINKMKHKKIKYQYKYGSTQTIDFIDKSFEGFSLITRISGIPTELGVLDTEKLI